MRTLTGIVVLALVFTGCTPPAEKPTVKPISSLDEIQGTWVVVEATDPKGNGFEADKIEVVIEGNKATSDGQTLRLEFTAEGSFMKMYLTVNGSERLAGEVAVEITTEASPTQMVWMDRINTKQVTLLQRK
jgi:hypothetical protein